MSDLGDYIRAMAAWMDEDPFDERITSEDIRKAAIDADAISARLTEAERLLADADLQFAEISEHGSPDHGDIADWLADYGDYFKKHRAASSASAERS